MNPDELRKKATETERFIVGREGGDYVSGSQFEELREAAVAAADAWEADRARVEELEKENAALRANTSQSVLRRLEAQGALAGKP
jgi:hypothetical protein